MTSLQPFSFAALALLLFHQGCASSGAHRAFRGNASADGTPTRVLAVYEPWFGHPRHIDVGYSSQDPVAIKKQIRQAKSLGISGFVVDWYGDREPFLDRSYSLLQSIAGEQNFHVAMMFDESNHPADQATDDALAAFDKFQQKYLSPDAPGRKAYLEYHGRPVIFIFPKGGHTDWNRVRAQTDKWNPAPLLIYEYASGIPNKIFDGFFAWVNPGKQGWQPDGSNWGEDYLRDFYQSMQTKYEDKIAVGGAWAGFDDRHASWSLSRYMSQRCGATFSDTMKLGQEYFPPNRPLPFLLIATWNDYEEGTAVERGLEKCKMAPGSPGS